MAMSDLSEVMKAVENQGSAFAEFRTRYEQTLERMGERLGRFEAGAARTALPGGQSARLGTGLDLDAKALGDAVRACFRGDETHLKGMSVNVDAGGGYFVVAALSESMTRTELDYSPIRQLARVIPIESDAYEEPLDKDSPGASWVAETAARTATTSPQVAMIRIPVNEIYAMPEATQQLIDDSRFNIVEWLSMKVGLQFGIAEGLAFVTGDGIGKPRGFLSYPTAATADATRLWGTLEHVATGAAGAFGADPNGANKLIDVVHKLKAGYRRGAVWLMNKKTVGEVRKLKDTAGRFVWVDSLLPSVPPSLLGYPVVEAEDMPDIAANSLSIAFGNFGRGYTIVDRVGLRFLVDPFTNKPYVRLYTYKRVGGDVNDFLAIKLLKFA
jgi:HK97 family phage major capsid protein